MVNDRYRLGDVIGTGGMSEVYRATDSLLGRDVAIKMLRPEMALPQRGSKFGAFEPSQYCRGL